jgi:DNA uptake protein ComE-like DNA-binding protein
MPTIIAIAVALAGLGNLAVRQSAMSSPPTIREGALPTAERHTLIDLNTATPAELATLPGIGASRAEAIVLIRAQQPFRSLADLADRGVLRPTEVLALADLATAYVTIE